MINVTVKVSHPTFQPYLAQRQKGVNSRIKHGKALKMLQLWFAIKIHNEIRLKKTSLYIKFYQTCCTRNN